MSYSPRSSLIFPWFQFAICTFLFSAMIQHLFLHSSSFDPCLLVSGTIANWSAYQLIREIFHFLLEHCRIPLSHHHLHRLQYFLKLFSSSLSFVPRILDLLVAKLIAAINNKFELLILLILGIPIWSRFQSVELPHVLL